MGLAGQPLSIAPTKCHVKFVGVGKDEIIGVDKFAQQNAQNVTISAMAWTGYRAEG